MKQLCNVCKVVGLFTAVGAINWGLVALFHVNLVDRLLGEGSMLAKVVYTLVGISGVMILVSYFKVCPACIKKG